MKLSRIARRGLPRRSGRITLALTALVFVPLAAALDGITPDPVVQSAIAAVPAAKSAAEMDAALAALRTSVRGDADRLVPQLLYFSMRATDVRAAMSAGVVIDRLQISTDALLHAIAPYLDTNDPPLQRQLSGLLDAIDEAPEGAARDFSRYAVLLRAHASNPPVALVIHMVHADPDLALATLAETSISDGAARAALLRAAKGSDDAAVDSLVGDPAWWVRLFVVARLQREPHLRSAGRVQRLRADAHPAVRAAANDLPR
ncbi:MAG: hypothetical protein U0802_15805 [Candidatus Binatia bacterium]